MAVPVLQLCDARACHAPCDGRCQFPALNLGSPACASKLSRASRGPRHLWHPCRRRADQRCRGVCCAENPVVHATAACVNRCAVSLFDCCWTSLVPSAVQDRRAHHAASPRVQVQAVMRKSCATVAAFWMLLYLLARLSSHLIGQARKPSATPILLQL